MRMYMERKTNKIGKKVEEAIARAMETNGLAYYTVSATGAIVLNIKLKYRRNLEVTFPIKGNSDAVLFQTEKTLSEIGPLVAFANSNKASNCQYANDEKIFYPCITQNNHE